MDSKSSKIVKAPRLFTGARQTRGRIAVRRSGRRAWPSWVACWVDVSSPEGGCPVLPSDHAAPIPAGNLRVACRRVRVSFALEGRRVSRRSKAQARTVNRAERAEQGSRDLAPHRVDFGGVFGEGLNEPLALHPGAARESASHHRPGAGTPHQRFRNPSRDTRPLSGVAHITAAGLGIDPRPVSRSRRWTSGGRSDHCPKLGKPTGDETASGEPGASSFFGSTMSSERFLRIGSIVHLLTR